MCKVKHVACLVTNLQRVLTNSAAHLSSTEHFSLFQPTVFCFVFHTHHSHHKKTDKVSS